MQISGSFLPNELIEDILSHLPGKDLARSSSVCRAFNDNASNYVWNKILQQEYPILEESSEFPKLCYKMLTEHEKDRSYSVCMGPPPPPKFPPLDLDKFLKKLNKPIKSKEFDFLQKYKPEKFDFSSLLKESNTAIFSMKPDFKDLFKKIELIPEITIRQEFSENVFAREIAQKIDTACEEFKNFLEKI